MGYLKFNDYSDGTKTVSIGLIDRESGRELSFRILVAYLGLLE